MMSFNSLPGTKIQVSNSKRPHEAPFVIWRLEPGTSDSQLPTILLNFVLRQAA